jgi:hypothetical protein
VGGVSTSAGVKQPLVGKVRAVVGSEEGHEVCALRGEVAGGHIPFGPRLSGILV